MLGPARERAVLFLGQVGHTASVAHPNVLEAKAGSTFVNRPLGRER